MDFDDLGGYRLTGLDRKNVLLGKNGCGKSRLLKEAERALPSQADVGVVRYLSPERGGMLQYDPGIEQNLTTNVNWLPDSRRRNQAENFRQQSTAQFRRLELLILREIEGTPDLRSNLAITFDTTVSRINKLLDRIYLKRGDPTFIICDKGTHAPVQASEISSGESELVSLGIECLVFEKEARADKYNLLLIDEPDVHLHPDLQARFAVFIDDLVAGGLVSVLIATHSTALLGAMSEDDHTRLAFMRYGEVDLNFHAASDALKRVLPVFGAHPLSNVFNQAPVLLLEGEDDERIWQQVVRSSNGRIKVYPCAVDGITSLSDFEQEVSHILTSVYDDAIGFSLRDRDLGPAEIDDIPPVKRMRLHCRTAENLLLTDEVLATQNLTWEQLKERINAWVEAFSKHPHHGLMKVFADGGYDRLNGNLKDIRNDLVALMGSSKPWEVLVGKCIAALQPDKDPAPTSMVAYLGPEVCSKLLGLA